MNILNLMPRFKLNPTGPDEQEQSGPRGRKTQGPQAVRHITNGQIRRGFERTQKTAKRKANLRFRRRWMDNRLAVAVLRGQLETVAAIKTPADRYMVGQSGDLMRNAHEALVERYGSVDAAVEHYEAILAEAV